MERQTEVLRVMLTVNCQSNQEFADGAALLAIASAAGVGYPAAGALANAFTLKAAANLDKAGATATDADLWVLTHERALTNPQSDI